MIRFDLHTPNPRAPQLMGCDPPVEPADHVDGVCMNHDLAWCACFEHRAKVAATASRGSGAPAKPHPVLLSARFLTMPAPLYRRLFDERFRACIFDADRELVKTLDGIEASGALPEWWDKGTK